MSDDSFFAESPELWASDSGEESDKVVPPTPPQHEPSRLPSSFGGPEPSQIVSTDDENEESEKETRDLLKDDYSSELDQQEDQEQQESVDDEQGQDDNDQSESEDQEVQKEQSESEIEEEVQEEEVDIYSDDDEVDVDVVDDADDTKEEVDDNIEDFYAFEDDSDQEQNKEFDEKSDQELDEVMPDGHYEEQVEEQSDEPEDEEQSAENVEGNEEPSEELNEEQPEEPATAEANSPVGEEEVTIISSDDDAEAETVPQYEDSGSEYVDEDENYKQHAELQDEPSSTDEGDYLDDDEQKAFHHASTPASRYAFKRPSKEAQRLINYLDVTLADDLSTHLYSTHLLHRINPRRPQSVWTSWPTRHMVYTPTIDTPTVPRPADLTRQDVERKLNAQLRGTGNSDNNIKHNGAGGDNDEGFVRRLPKFDPTIAAVTGNLTANDQWTRYPISEYKSSSVLGSVLGHGGGTKYTSTTGRPQEMPYNSVAQGIPPFDYTRHRRVAEPLSEEDRAAFEHARKLVMFEISATFERIVRQRIEEENQQQAKLDVELGVPPQKRRRRLVVSPDFDFKMPQQALARMMDTVDRILLNTVAIQQKFGVTKTEDWITVIQNDAAVGSVFARCKKLFMDDVDDPRDFDSDVDDDDNKKKEKKKEKKRSRKRKHKTETDDEEEKEEEEEEPPQAARKPKVIRSRLNFKTLNRVNNMSLAMPPDSFVRPEITSFEPDLHAVNGLSYSQRNLMQTSINPIYTCGLQSTTKLKPHKALEEYQPEDMAFYNPLDDAAAWNATPHARRLRLTYENLGRYAQPIDGYSSGGSLRGSAAGTGRSYDQNWILEEYTPDLMSRPAFDSHVHYTQLEAERQHGRTAVLRHARALRRLRRGSGGGRRFLKRAGVPALYRKWKRKCAKRRRRQLRALRKQQKRAAAAAAEAEEGRTANDDDDDDDENLNIGIDDDDSSDGEIPRLLQALNAEVFQKMAVSARTPVMAPRKYAKHRLGLW